MVVVLYQASSTGGRSTWLCWTPWRKTKMPSPIYLRSVLIMEPVFNFYTEFSIELVSNSKEVDIPLGLGLMLLYCKRRLCFRARSDSPRLRLLIVIHTRYHRIYTWILFVYGCRWDDGTRLQTRINFEPFTGRCSSCCRMRKLKSGRDWTWSRTLRHVADLIY